MQRWLLLRWDFNLYNYSYFKNTKFIDLYQDCDFEEDPTYGWSCEGMGSLLGERTYAFGSTKEEAYKNYVKQVRKDDYEQRNGIQEQ